MLVSVVVCAEISKLYCRHEVQARLRRAGAVLEANEPRVLAGISNMVWMGSVSGNAVILEPEVFFIYFLEKTKTKVLTFV
jgi:hypothetical protein